MVACAIEALHDLLTGVHADNAGNVMIISFAVLTAVPYLRINIYGAIFLFPYSRFIFM